MKRDFPAVLLKRLGQILFQIMRYQVLVVTSGVGRSDMENNWRVNPLAIAQARAYRTVRRGGLIISGML